MLCHWTQIRMQKFSYQPRKKGNHPVNSFIVMVYSCIRPESHWIKHFLNKINLLFIFSSRTLINYVHLYDVITKSAVIKTPNSKMMYYHGISSLSLVIIITHFPLIPHSTSATHTEPKLKQAIFHGGKSSFCLLSWCMWRTFQIIKTKTIQFPYRCLTSTHTHVSLP